MKRFLDFVCPTVFHVLFVGMVAVVAVVGVLPKHMAYRQIDLKKQTGKDNVLETLGNKTQIFYFKDERTGLCFAYYWGQKGKVGGPALTVVPEEKVKDFLMK